MSKKGITPVLATSMLILIAISAISASAVFLRDTTGDITDAVDEDISKDERAQGSSISVERGFNASGFIALRVRNTGEYVVTVEDEDSGGDDNFRWTMYVDGRPEDFRYLDGSDPPMRTIVSGEVVEINTTEPYPSSSSDWKRIEINGQYGVESSIICSSSGGSQSC